jgi:carboxyl-terminal processing protease
VKARAGIAYAVGLIAFLVLGLWLGGHPAKLPDFLRDRVVDATGGLSAEGAELLEDNYYRPVGGTELSNSSLQGMVRGLRRRHKEDRFTEYFSPESLEGFNQQIEGHFSGVGISVVPVKAGLRAVQVFPRSPAAEAGIEVGDTIVSVDGDTIAGESSSEATAKIKGPEGTEVTVGVRDAKSSEVRQVHLVRAEVALPNVSSRVEKVDGRELGYIRMLSFSEGVSALLANAVRKVEGEGAQGIVLDLRGNPGGLLDEAVLSASLFLPKDEVVVSTDSRTQGHSVHKTVGGTLPKLPLVLLIDRNSASAAEILAAALADDAGAPVVGTRSYGKGVFQEEKGLANGGALKITVGEYFTPKGVNLARSHGIHPDVEASDDPETPVDEGKARALGVLAGQVEG